MTRNIFRQVSLERLSSPEQLDQLLQITRPRTWLALFAVLMLLAAAGVWSVTGSVVTKAAGMGVIVRRGGVLNVVTSRAGVVVDVKVQPGLAVRANQVVATIAQPVIVQQLALLRSAREEAVLNRERSLEVLSSGTRLRTEANARQRSNVESHLSELQQRKELTAQQVIVERNLLQQGLVTNQQVLDLQQKEVDLGDQIAGAHAQLKQLDSDRYAIVSEPGEQDMPLRGRISDLDRQIATAEQTLKLAKEVVSPYDGQVLEVKTSPGSTVAEAQPIISIQPNKQSLEVLAYIPSLLAKDVRAGMESEVSPSNIKREEYGFIRGRTTYVADYPATEAAVMRNFENESLVHALTEVGPVTEISIGLADDAATTSGFSWSSSQGPSVVVTSGTLCQVNIVTRREKPISLVFPYLKAKTGL